jgi:hypothetical protein
MPTPEEILGQQQLLEIHRRTLFHYVEQKARLGSAHIPPQITHGIFETRKEIRQTKERLRSWGVSVTDLPNEEESYEALASKAEVGHKDLVLPKQSVRPILKPTGDPVVDETIEELQKLEQQGNLFSESQLAGALKRLFARPAFYGIREENWHYFLFALIKTRLILEHYQHYFRNSPKVRSKLAEVTELMTQLQNDVAYLYGRSFSVTEHIHKYGGNKDEFLKNLPPLCKDPDYRFFDDRDKTIRKIRSILRSIDLVD